MMKGPKFLNAASAIIMAVALIAINICMFVVLESFTTVFWISFAFSIIACVVSLFLLFRDTGIGEKKQLYAYILYPVVTYYLIAQIVVALISVHFLEKHVLLSFVLQTVILVVFLITYLIMRRANESVKEQQEIRGRDILSFKAVLESAKSVLAKVDYSASYRKTVQKAVDALASGQVRSTPAAEDVERQIKDQIGELSRAVDDNNEEKITQISRNIERLAEERTNLISSQRALF